MTLIKDLQNHRIIYYWIDQSENQLSPLLASLPLADEWRRNYLHNTYDGYQRRSTSVDRRRYQHKREMHQGHSNVSALFSGGRRASDRNAKVDVDRAAAKLKALFNHHEVNAQNPQRQRH